MFKKTRIRIFSLIVTVATLVIVLMLSVIYIANMGNSFERSISLIESYIENYENNLKPESNPIPERPNFRPGMKDDHGKMFKLSTFYSVLYDENGEVKKVNYNDGLLYSEQEILEIANSVISSGKQQGKYNKMPYLVRTVDEGTIVVFIDNTVEADNSDKLFENSLIVGLSTWAIIVILAWFLSKKIVYPLEQNDIKQKQFISDAGHELKTPISVINANAELLSREIGENKWLANIQYENERMGNVVAQLLELSRTENIIPKTEHLNFSRLVSGGVLPFESVAFEKGILINTDIAENLFIDGDPNRLSQLVSILVDNAVSHSSGKKITVKLADTKSSAVLSVINEGEPISNEIKERIFERFFKVDEARTDDNGHFGLGLSIAKAIVNAHKGKIEVNCYSGLVEFKIIIPKNI